VSDVENDAKFFALFATTIAANRCCLTMADIVTEWSDTADDLRR